MVMKISFAEAPSPEAMKIIQKALTEAICPVDLYKELGSVGVCYTLFHVYLAKFFGVDYMTAKNVSLKIRFGDTKAWRNYSDITDDKVAIMYVPLKACSDRFDE
jgi:hypothetical protein